MRRKLVQGIGNPTAKIMVIGEAPGAQEEKLGVPFVGPSGDTLNSWLEVLELKREELFITNLVKYKLPNNRRPTQEEIDSQKHLLNAEIAQIDPDVVLILGVTTSKHLIGVEKMEDCAANVFSKKVWYRERLLIPFYHPAYVNRFGTEELKASINDKLQTLKEVLTELGKIGLDKPE